MSRLRGVLLSLLVVVASCAAPASKSEPSAALHAYYLFVDSPDQSSEYVPMLLTPKTLESIGASGSEARVTIVMTYARDSIWSVERDVALAGDRVSADRRELWWCDARYQYQEIPPAEALRLLEHPMGTIPIHRLRGPPRDLQDFIEELRGDQPRMPTSD